MKNICKRGDWT